MKKLIPLLFLGLAAIGLMLLLNACEGEKADSGPSPQTGAGGSMARFARSREMRLLTVASDQSRSSGTRSAISTAVSGWPADQSASITYHSASLSRFSTRRVPRCDYSRNRFDYVCKRKNAPARIFTYLRSDERAF